MDIRIKSLVKFKKSISNNINDTDNEEFLRICRRTLVDNSDEVTEARFEENIKHGCVGVC